MKVLMFGRGVIASVYGWALENAGHHIDYYVRPTSDLPDHIEFDLLDLRRRPWGEPVTGRWPVTLRRDIPTEHDYDVIIVSVGHHRLAEALATIAPRVGKATVVVLGNVWPNADAVTGAIPSEQIVWGFPGAGGGFQPDGRLHAALLPSLKLEVRSPRADAVRGLFRSAGIRVRHEPDLHGWLAIHFMLDAGMLSQGLRLGTLSNMIGNTEALREAFLTSQELLPVLEASGVELGRHRGTTLPARTPRATAAALGWAIAHLPPARISLAGHTDPHAEEPRALCRDALAAAHQYGVPAPRLEALEGLFAR